MSPMVSRPFTIEFVLLGLLEDNPCHGYELEQMINQDHGLGQIWKVKQSHLYAILQKLELARLVDSHLEPQAGRPSRLVYSLTPEGVSEFKKWVRSPVSQPRQIRQEFLARLFFALRKGPDQAQSLLKSQIDICLGWSEKVQKELSALSKEDLYEEILLKYRMSNMQAVQNWLVDMNSALSRERLNLE